MPSLRSDLEDDMFIERAVAPLKLCLPPAVVVLEATMIFFFKNLGLLYGDTFFLGGNQIVPIKTIGLFLRHNKSVE